MKLKERVKAFIQLGKVLQNFVQEKPWIDYSCGLTEEEYNSINEVIKKAFHHNGWFSEHNVRQSIEGIVYLLNEENISDWVSKYQLKETEKTVAVIMAGNIPMVGFHDLLCVLISGNKLEAKLSSEDAILLPMLVSLLIQIEPQFENKIKFVPRLNKFDAIIATGNDNSARYFKSYFEKYPNIIRKNRTSIAVISGKETEQELEDFAKDVFSYFGKGCRNVTKVFVPKAYDLNKLFNAFFPYKELANNNKYANNYDYNKAIYLMNSIELIENGFLLMKEDESIHSPLAVLNYEFYESKNKVETFIKQNQEKIQCVVSSSTIPFGKAQKPELWDYADGVDTMSFLANI